jgi:hypothetical protein
VIGHLSIFSPVFLVVGGLVLALNVHAARLSEVDVTSMGFGKNEAQAVQDALINSIAQVNGEAVVASSQLREISTTKASSDEKNSREIQRQIAEEINRKTKGVLKSWSVGGISKTESGDFSATVNAKVVALERSQQLDRLKLAVVSPKDTAQPYTGQLVSGVTKELTASRKFAVIDRRNSEVIEAQLDKIRQGRGQIADQVRLISELAPDVLVVLRVETTDRGAGKQNAFGLVEVIDYSTRQIKYSDRKPMIIDDSKPSSVANRMSVLSKMITRSILETAYPPTVVGQTGATVTIAQGKDFFNIGDQVMLIRLGKDLRDPHTGEFLSSEKEQLGAGKIIYTDARISQAKLSGDLRLDSSSLANKKILVEKVLQGDSGDHRGNPSLRAKKSTVSSLLDDED